ncbi:MAG: branched-chain amino acid ABC transporter permease [Ruminococcaceae bacterium]|nr:branched-chain amino acid ABC transporter permease [Oscillospiraceae bacterium]
MMKREMRFNKGIILPAICLIVAILIPQVVTQKYILQVGTTLLFFSCFSSAWNIIGGYAGQFALGNGLFIGVGAYAAGICYVGGFCSPWIGMLIGMVVSALLSAVISRPCFRLSGTYFSLSTVAFLYIGLYIVSSIQYIGDFKLGASLGLLLPYSGRWQDMQFTKPIWFYVVLGALVITISVSAWIKNHRIGYYLMAISSDQDASATTGINVVMYKTYAQMISSALMAMAGSLYGFYLLTVMPAKVLSYTLTLEIMMYCVIGGRGTLWGPVIGAAIMGFISEFMRTRMGASAASLGTVFYGIALIVVVRFAPGGIYGLISSLSSKLSGKLKKGEKAIKKEEA